MRHDTTRPAQRADRLDAAASAAKPRNRDQDANRPVPGSPLATYCAAIIR